MIERNGTPVWYVLQFQGWFISSAVRERSEKKSLLALNFATYDLRWQKKNCIQQIKKIKITV